MHKRRDLSHAVYQDHVRCLECGKMFKAITPFHLRKHGMTSVDYAAKFGSFCFLSLAMRKRISEEFLGGPRRDSRRSAYKPRLPDQILRELRSYVHGDALLGQDDVWRKDPALVLQAKRAFGSWIGALEAAGLPHRTRRSWDKGSVKKAIFARAQEGKPINSRALTNDDSGLLTSAVHYFGSWADALKACGVNYEKVRLKRVWNRERVGQALKKWAKKHGALRYVSMQSTDLGLYLAMNKYYGSAKKAGRALGLAVHCGRPVT